MSPFVEQDDPAVVAVDPGVVDALAAEPARSATRRWSWPGSRPTG